MSLLALIAGPVYGSDQVTVNTSDLAGEQGVLLAAPPGSCTAAIGGTIGTCNDRGTAAAAANVGGTFFTDTTWSDLKEADVPLTENGNTEVGLVTADGTVVPDGATPDPDTDIGASWVPFFCSRPQCGHLLRGDALQYDENGDGSFDDTWIDKNFNGVIDNGEIDRTRVEQFSWGVTSVIRDLTDLGTDMAQGNMFPAGLARTRVRVALGDASTAGDCDAQLTTASCLDGNAAPANPLSVDTDYWARCDPDKFHPSTTTDPTITTVAEGQRALDNCLWWITALPIFPTDAVVDEALAEYAQGNDYYLDNGHLFDQRQLWLDQAVDNRTYASVTDAQDYAQTMYVGYGFEKIADLERARYQNVWEIRQQDFDPNTDVNGNTSPDNVFTAASPGPGRDTYDYAFAIRHQSQNRGRGEDFDGGNLGADCVANSSADCDGKTNPTLDPFWNEQWRQVGLSLVERWNQQFEYVEGEPCGEACLDSGVGQEEGLSFLTAQDVNGYFETCFNCAPAAEEIVPLLTPQPTYMPYQTAWNVVPTVVHAP